jgi:hypothetical protein
MRKPRGAAFKGSFRYKRTRRHYGKQKIVKVTGPHPFGTITHLNEPSYVTTPTLGTAEIQYSYLERETASNPEE